MTSIITPSEVAKFQKSFVDYREAKILQAYLKEINRSINAGEFVTIIEKDSNSHYLIKLDVMIQDNDTKYKFSTSLTKPIKEAFEDAGWGYCNCDTMMVANGFITIKLYPDVPFWYKK